MEKCGRTGVGTGWYNEVWVAGRCWDREQLGGLLGLDIRMSPHFLIPLLLPFSARHGHGAGGRP